MSVWFAIPSKRPPEEAEPCLSKWRAQGYKIALWRDEGDPEIKADLLIVGEYQGYHHAVNALCRAIMALDPEASWIVSGGDDMCPDPKKCADEIAAECTAHFGGTFGVVQPVGDTWGDPQRICGSPWMGREFCRRMYQGRGPFCEAYYHMWGDEEMHELCKARGILWNRPDLSHYHHHWIREAQASKQPLKAPAFLARAIPCYEGLMPLYRARKAANYPGHEPID
jgi:hypothetical protein